MQIMELFIFLLAFGLLVGFIKFNQLRKRYLYAYSIVTFLVAMLYVFFGNVTWQLYPLYLAVIIVVCLIILTPLVSKRVLSFRKTKAVGIGLLFLMIFTSLGLKYAFPIYDIPEPSGSYLIGTKSIVLEDETREELYGTSGNRRIKIQFWYPTNDIEDYDLVPWLEDGQTVARALANDTGLPFFVLDHTADIMSNSYQDAPISDDLDQYPIVVISHGWRGFRNLHTDLAEELASNGYIVISIDHTYGSVATVFNDEDVAYVNLDALPNRDDSTDFLTYANQLVYTYAGDITFTLNYLEKLNVGDVSSIFEGRLDIDSIGLIGHSTGGGANVAAAINDTRVKAIFGMDAWVEPIYNSEIEKGLDIPVLFLRSETWETGQNNNNLLQLVNGNSEQTELYQIDGTTHYDFSMAYMYSPLTKPLGMTGALNGEELVEIFTSMMTEFFDQTLIEDSDLSPITIDTPWAEVNKIE